MEVEPRDFVFNAHGLVSLDIKSDIATIVLQNPSRHNCLTIDFLEQFLTCITTANKYQGLTAIVLKAQGKSFSTGGDVSAFYEHYDTIEAYSHQIVGLLNQSISQMLRGSTPIIARVQGPVTGGSFGFILASDLVVMADSAFFAPYYVEVGFAPDGGWTAILPDRIGEQRAKSVQLLNTHIEPELALTWGLVDCIAPTQMLDIHIDEWISTLRAKVTHDEPITKHNIMDETRILHYEEKLEQERTAFINAIVKPETKIGMEKFLHALQKKPEVSP